MNNITLEVITKEYITGMKACGLAFVICIIFLLVALFIERRREAKDRDYSDAAFIPVIGLFIVAVSFFLFMLYIGCQILRELYQSIPFFCFDSQ